MPLVRNGGVILRKRGSGALARSKNCCCDALCSGGFNYYGLIVAPGDVVLDPSLIIPLLPLPATTVYDVNGVEAHLAFFGLWVEFEVFYYYAKYTTCVPGGTVIGFVNEFQNYEDLFDATMPAEGYSIETTGAELTGGSSCNPDNIAQELTFFDDVAGASRVIHNYYGVNCPR